ncbi:MAG: protein kinase domain-containing protein [Myxococcota bacterium]
MPEHSAQSSQVIPAGADVPQPGDLVAGKYRVEGTLGVGGMGVVLAARNELLGQPVAIKFLVVHDEEYLGEATQRLLREARAAAQLRGEHVVRVYDVGELPNGTPFIVMERLHGSDLGEISRLLGQMPIPVAVAFVVQAARAISEAHAIGIVHRDLKPSNLFIVRQPDGKALLKVVDFGISKSLRPENVEVRTLTGARMALGSPHYMSPEQVRDARRVDARSDVWALGVILYELVAGRPAFHADSYPGIFAAITADVPLSLSTLRPEVAAGLERIVQRCLERDPALRYQTADELARALDDYAARELKYDELFRTTEQALDAGPHTLRAAPTPSGARPAPNKLASLDPDAPGNTVGLTRTKLSAADVKVDVSEPVASQDIPAIANSSPLSLETPPTRRSITGEPAPQAAGQARNKYVAIALAAVAVALAVLWRFQAQDVTEQKPAPAPSASSMPSATITLNIESNPPGARVTEGERELGVTPLRVSLPSVAGAGEMPRTFVLSLPGYRPHVFERAPGPEATFLHVDLVREAPPPVPSTAATEAPAARVPVSAPPAAPRARPARPAPSAAVEAPPDIRLVR